MPDLTKLEQLEKAVVDTKAAHATYYFAPYDAAAAYAAAAYRKAKRELNEYLELQDYE